MYVHHISHCDHSRAHCDHRTVDSQIPSMHAQLSNHVLLSKATTIDTKYGMIGRRQVIKVQGLRMGRLPTVLSKRICVHTGYRPHKRSGQWYMMSSQQQIGIGRTDQLHGGVKLVRQGCSFVKHWDAQLGTLIQDRTSTQSGRLWRLDVLT